MRERQVSALHLRHMLLSEDPDDDREWPIDEDESEAEREEAAQEEWSEFLEWQRGLGAEPNFNS